MEPSTAFGPIRGDNILAGISVSGGQFVANFNSVGLGQRPPAQACRVIPFPRNKGLVYRANIFSKLEKLLLPSSGFHSAALWGLGGSG